MTENDTVEPTRRGVLRGAAGGAAAALSLSAAGVAGAAEAPDIDDWLEDTDNYDGTVEDLRGNDEVRIEVGVDTGFLFGPPAVRVDPGTTVVWEWVGQGGQHNVHAMEGASFESELTDEEGFTYSQTIEETGIITYQCDPHATVGMKGVLVVGDIQVGTADVRPDFGGWLADVDGGYRDARGTDEVTVEVGAAGNGGNLAFGPAGLWVDPGTTIRFEWTGEGGRHNVVAREGPADLDSGSPVDTTGVEYEYTVADGGITNYVCEPHATVGMKGAIAVGGDVPTVAAGGGGDSGEGAGGSGPAFTLPGGDPGVAIVLAVFGITGVAALSVLASEFRDALAAAEATAPEPDDGIVREINHEEFSPTGTASLIAIYFLILVGLWFFMYFVEFLGNGPTIIG